jgi:hypothetical protein
VNHLKESLYVIDKTTGEVYLIGRDTEAEKIQGLQKALNFFGEMDLEFCREDDPLLNDYVFRGNCNHIGNLITEPVLSNLKYVDVLMYFENSNDRIGF